MECGGHARAGLSRPFHANCKVQCPLWPGWPGLPGVCPQGEFPRETVLLFLGVGGEQGRAAHSYSSPAAHEPVQRSGGRAGWAAEGLPVSLLGCQPGGHFFPLPLGWTDGMKGRRGAEG